MFKNEFSGTYKSMIQVKIDRIKLTPGVDFTITFARIKLLHEQIPKAQKDSFFRFWDLCE